MDTGNPLYTVGSSLRLPITSRRWDVMNIEQRESGNWYQFNLSTGDWWTAYKWYPEIQLKVLNPVAFAEPLTFLEPLTPAEIRALELIKEDRPRIDFEEAVNDIADEIMVNSWSDETFFWCERMLRFFLPLRRHIRTVASAVDVMDGGTSTPVAVLKQRAEYAAKRAMEMYTRFPHWVKFAAIYGACSAVAQYGTCYDDFKQARAVAMGQVALLQLNTDGIIHDLEKTHKVFEDKETEAAA